MAPEPSKGKECLLQAIVLRGCVEESKGEKGQRFSFGGLLTQFLRGYQIKEEVADCRPRYDLKGIDVTDTKDVEGIHGLVLSISECDA
ncbi:hypothetical protein HAX54_048600 [Datura stramonium]|uniref:Uncharacterized protein n=1 Tax=Datura stramonium TaxID=4076 RepID=A0ABS8WJG7_DATST|nr:hypothetical protein [Datura stramonium]